MRKGNDDAGNLSVKLRRIESKLFVSVIYKQQQDDKGQGTFEERGKRDYTAPVFQLDKSKQPLVRSVDGVSCPSVSNHARVVV